MFKFPTLARLFPLFATATLLCAASSLPEAHAQTSRRERIQPQGAPVVPLHWVDTWTSPLVSPTNDTLAALNTPPPSFTNQTLRMITHTSVGGNSVQVRISNLFGTQPLNIGAAHIAIRDTGANILAGTDRVLTFSGQPTTSIPAGALALSDPVSLTVPQLGDLAVSIYLPDPVTPDTTLQPFSHQTTYISLAGTGDATGATTFPAGGMEKTCWFFLTGVEVLAPTTVSTFVAFGDSITEGLNSTDNTNRRWPDRLAVRLFGQNTPWGVANEGISGNKVLVDQAGPSGLSRFDREVLAQPGVTHAAVLLGINDINGGANAPNLIAGHRQFIARAHDRGVKIIGCTLTPSGAADGSAQETARTTLNDFIRNSAEYDALIDFDAATRDPANPRFFLPPYNSGDNLHPNDTGYQAMADSIDLKVLKGFVPLTSVVSRKVHGTNPGTAYDLVLPQAFGATPAIECRRGGANGDYTLIFQFGVPITSILGASIVESTGSVVSQSSGIDVNDPTRVIVNLTGVTSGQYVTVGLTNVSDGTNTSSVRATMGVLVGDTTGDGVVNSSDVAQTQSRSGQAITAANFRADVNVDQSIDASDIALVTSKSGTGLPATPIITP